MDVFIKVLKACLQAFSSNDNQQSQPPQGQGQQSSGQGGTYAHPDGKPTSQPHHQQQPSYPPHQPQSPHTGGGGGGGGAWQSTGQSHKPSGGHKYQGHLDANQHNQSDPHYTALRDRARQEGDSMAQCFSQSHQAYESGDGARAKQLSEEGKKHKAEMERINKEASDWIYYQNNTDSAADEVDLHGLYVAEAISRTEAAIQKAQSQGKDHLDIIVGKGLHSQGHVAKIKPAIEDLMQKYNLRAEIDPNNAGVLIVHLGGGQSGSRGIGSDEITDRLDSNKDCVIM